MRIVWIHRVNRLGATYGLAVLYIFTALEPLLGIVLACLPLIRPVANKISESPPMSWHKLKSTWGSSEPIQQGSPGSGSMLHNYPVGERTYGFNGAP